MNPEKGQYVKILFNNGTTAEGIVQSWSDEKSVLISENRESILIVQKSKEDILTVIINTKYKTKEEANRKQEELVNEVPKTKKTIQELAELRKELNRHEREDFFNATRSHEMSQVGSVGHYVLPNFSKKPRVIQRPGPQDKRTNVRHYSGLLEMFDGEDEDNG